MDRPGSLAGKVCVITGAAGSIGLASARLFVAEGARVMLADLDTGPLTRAVAELPTAGRTRRHWSRRASLADRDGRLSDPACMKDSQGREKLWNMTDSCPANRPKTGLFLEYESVANPHGTSKLAPACHAGGRGFEPRPLRQKSPMKSGTFGSLIFSCAQFLSIHVQEFGI